jgi:hypothetical protein
MPAVSCAICRVDLDSDKCYEKGHSFHKMQSFLCPNCYASHNSLEDPWISDLDINTGRDKHRLLLAKSFVKVKAQVK